MVSLVNFTDLGEQPQQDRAARFYFLADVRVVGELTLAGEQDPVGDQHFEELGFFLEIGLMVGGLLLQAITDAGLAEIGQERLHERVGRLLTELLVLEDRHDRFPKNRKATICYFLPLN